MFFSLVENASQALGVKEGVRVNGLLTWMSSDFYSSLGSGSIELNH